jgi:SAM-dependent methyltransferase
LRAKAIVKGHPFMAHYGNQIYWERRYGAHRSAVFDWYLPYSDPENAKDGNLLREELNNALRHGSRILYVGCGTSCLGEGLYDDGYTNMVCVDWSPSAIATMAERSKVDPVNVPKELLEPTDEADLDEEDKVGRKHRGNIIYMVLNATELLSAFGERSFDVVVEKGLLDVSFCGENEKTQRSVVATIVKNIWGVLKPGGKFLHVTYTDKTTGARQVLYDDDSSPWSNIQVTPLVHSIAPDSADAAVLVALSAQQSSTSAPSTQDGNEFLTRTHYLFSLTK